MESFDQLFEASFARVLGEGAYNPELIGRFYEIFLASSPQIALRFANTDMSRQKTMLHDSLLMLVDFNKRRHVTPQMQHLADIHGRGGEDVPPDLYLLWLDSLMDTIGEFDPEFDDNVELAWRMTMAPGVTFMQLRYERSTPR